MQAPRPPPRRGMPSPATTFDGLSPGASYRFRARGYNGVTLAGADGYGEYSAEATLRTASEPDAPAGFEWGLTL